MVVRRDELWSGGFVQCIQQLTVQFLFSQLSSGAKFVMFV